MKTSWIILLCIVGIFNTVNAQLSHAEMAEKYYKNGQLLAALNEVELALSKDSTDLGNLLLKGNILTQQKQYNDAYQTFSQLIKWHPQKIDGYNQRGILLYSIQHTEDALKDFDQALGFATGDTDKITLYMNRGAAKNSIRDFKGAYDDFHAAYLIDSSNVGILNNLAMVCQDVGKGDQTLGYLFRILKLNSTEISVYGNIGFAYQNMGDFKKAAEYFDKALKIQPNDPYSYSNRGYNWYKLGDYDKAMEDIEQSLTLYPENSYAIKTKALILIAQNKIEKACYFLDKALDYGFTKMYGDEVETLKAQYCKKNR